MQIMSLHSFKNVINKTYVCMCVCMYIYIYMCVCKRFWHDFFHEKDIDYNVISEKIVNGVRKGYEAND